MLMKERKIRREKEEEGRFYIFVKVLLYT